MTSAKATPTSVTLAALSPLLEFLDTRDVAALVCTQQNVGREGCAAIWFWLVSRFRSILPWVKLPRRPQCLHSNTLQVARLLPLLRQLQAVVLYNFDLHFDAARHGDDVRLVDCYMSHWGPNGGSMFGDRICAPGAVSYWECVGLSEGCYIGVAEKASHKQNGFRYFGVDAQNMKRTLSLPTPACDHMPAVMYCESGFITTGSFRGAKPQLPAKVNFLDADVFKEGDQIGVFVDLLAGFLLFLRNGKPQGMRIPIDRSKRYLPVFSAWACYNLRLIPNKRPPWHNIYYDESFDTPETTVALLGKCGESS